MTHAYGVLCYDFFTIAHDQAQLALEFALRERFVEFHGGTAQDAVHGQRAADRHDLSPGHASGRATAGAYAWQVSGRPPL
jgi:hypothetical protein